MSEMSYFDFEQLLVDRIKDKIDKVPARNILTADDLEGAKELSQPCPAIHVVSYDDNPITGSGGRGVGVRNQLVDQEWLVVVVVKNVRHRSGTAARSDAGPIVTQLISALQAWEPGHGYQPVLRVKAPYRQTYRNGFFYFPMLFTTRFTTKGVPHGS